MIVLPRRSVTRFFIPLIDVLTLLFCIFLLMPLVKNADPGEGAVAGETPSAVGGASAGRGSERSAAESADLLQRRLDIQVLEINGSNGKLFYFAPDPIEINSQAKARELIAERKQKAAGKELYFLILYPRELSQYPEYGQVEQYKRWFAGVAHKIDNPRDGR